MKREELPVETYIAAANLAMGVRVADLENGIAGFLSFEGLKGGMKMKPPYLELLGSEQNLFERKNRAC
jgi:hypothetical protein